MISVAQAAMMSDRDKWNRKYREKSFPTEPSRIVREFYHHARAGRALDLACGNGRNACFLAAHGFEVDAVDISEEGLQRFVCRSSGINRICQDLRSFSIHPRRYQLILNTRFLMRRLFPALQEGLLPGGVLIFETYLQEDPVAAGKIFGRHHLLKDNELRHAFPALQTLAYAESPSRLKDAPARKASLIAVRPSMG
jgi:tellurite methyltransferase